MLPNPEKNDIERGLLSEKKSLVPLNKIISNKKNLKKICIAISITLFFLINYIFNCIVNSFEAITNYSGLESLFSLKNLFIIHPIKYFLFYLLLIIFIAIVNIRLIYLVNVHIKDMNVGQKGHERWTTTDEIKEQYPSMLLSGSPINGKGGFPVCQYQGLIYFDDSPVNNLILGMTRSGKGEQAIFSMIWTYCNAFEKSSLVINDPKIELYPACYETLKKSGYEVYLFNLVEPLKGIGMNFIEGVTTAWKNKQYSHAESLARAISELIYHPSRLEGEAKYWASSSADLYSALILAMVADTVDEDEKTNAKYILEWRKRQQAYQYLSESEKELARSDFNRIGNKLSDQLSLPYIPDDINYIPVYEHEKRVTPYAVARFFMDLASEKIDAAGTTALDVFFSERPSNDMARIKFFGVQIAADRTKASIYSSMFSPLSIFTDSDVAKMTAHSTIQLSDLGFGEKPIALFLATPDWDTSRHFLVSLLISQIYSILSNLAAQRQSQCCTRNVVHILDEFGSMTQLSNIENMVSAGAGKGLLYTFVLQSFAQLDKYKEAGKTIRDNCGNKMYILSADEKTRKDFSSEVGSETITTVNRNGKYLSLNKSITEHYESRPLISAEELANLAEGENVIIRFVKRRTLNHEKIRAHPIFNTGETAFRYRYEYLSTVFPSDHTLNDFPFIAQCRSDFDLEDICIDTQKIFLQKKMRREAEIKGEQYYSEYESPETVQKITALKYSSIILSQLKFFVKDRNVENLTVSEAITEIENAASLGMISKSEKEGILDLILQEGADTIWE